MSILIRVLISYGLLLTMAAGGLAFANIFGFLATAANFGGSHAADASSVRTWMNTGWVFGVCLGLMGEVARRRFKKSKSSDAGIKKEPVKETISKSSDTPRQRKGFLVSAGWGGFFGMLFGIALGTTFILLWFSIAYSPFAPADWASSVVVEKDRSSTAARVELISKTDNSVALYCFAAPVVLGIIGGAAFGGIVRVNEDD